MHFYKKFKLVLAKCPGSCVAGFLISIVSWLLITISILLYPNTFNPLEDYMSFLGDPSYNPKGYFFYNLSLLLVGVLLLIFSIGLYLWYPNELINKVLLVISQILGFSLGITLFLILYFSVNFSTAHIFLSILSGFLGFSIIFFGGIFLIKQKESNKKVGIFIFCLFLIVIIYIILSSSIIQEEGNPLTEWIIKILGDIDMILIVYNFYYINKIRIRSKS